MHPRLVLVAIFVLTGLIGIAPKPMSAAEPSFYLPDSEECAVVALINQFRADNGKQPLVLLSSLGAAAEHKAEDMASRNYFSHTEPPTKSGGEPTSFSQNITNFGYTASGRGENLAAGYGSAQATFNQWEQSAPHRRNMLGEDIDFQAMGIGRAFNPDSDYGWYWTTTFGSTNSGDVVSCSSN